MNYEMSIRTTTIDLKRKANLKFSALRLNEMYLGDGIKVKFVRKSQS